MHIYYCASISVILCSEIIFILSASWNGGLAKMLLRVGPMYIIIYTSHWLPYCVHQNGSLNQTTIYPLDIRTVRNHNNSSTHVIIHWNMASVLNMTNMLQLKFCQIVFKQCDTHDHFHLMSSLKIMDALAASPIRPRLLWGPQTESYYNFYD